MPASYDNIWKGGLTAYRYLSVGTSQDATVIKAGPGMISWFCVTNINAAARYFKLYDKATAPSQTDTPVFSGTLLGAATGTNLILTIAEDGMTFQNGISFRLTTGIADSDVGGVTANQTVVNLGYI